MDIIFHSTIFMYVANGIIFLVVAQAIRMIVRLSKNKFLGLTTQPFSTTGQGKRVLILGDSTAVGTGADRPEDTIAGRLSHDHPTADIKNLAKNGGVVKDLLRQVAAVQGEQFDFIIISVGGNDVWHFTRLNKIKKILFDVLPKLVEMSQGRVIFLVYNTIGSAPVFPVALQYLLKWRCRLVQEVIYRVAYQCRVPTIDLFTNEERNPFLKEYGQKYLFAADGIHPSSEGYKLWYNRMWRVMHENGYRF